MNTSIVALALTNEYLSLLEKELKSYLQIMKELDEKITKEPSIYKKQCFENQRRLIGEEALKLYEEAIKPESMLKYINQRIG